MSPLVSGIGSPTDTGTPRQSGTILVDRDKEAALEYLRAVVMRKIEQLRQAGCKPPF